MAKATTGKDVLLSFFDEGAYTILFNESAVCAAFGSANGQPVYAICQKGEPVNEGDIKTMVKVLKLAAKTGNPVVTFYNAQGVVLGENLNVLNKASKLVETISKISGVVPQIAVVNGVCAATSALAASLSDVCIMAKDAELFLTAPFTAAAKGDKTQKAGTAEFAAKAGVASIVVENEQEAAKKAAELIGLLPANNLSGGTIYEASAPKGSYTLAKYDAKAAVDSIVDADSNLELYEGYGRNVYTALATVNGNVVGVVSTAGAQEYMCRKCVSKIARFVRFMDAFGIPVISIINTAGFKADCGEDLSGGVREAARLAGTYADATTAKIAVITGKAIGSAYVGLANADLTVAVQGCTISPVEPSVAATVLYNEEIQKGNDIAGDTAKKAAEYAKEVCSAQSALNSGVAHFAVDAAGIRGAVVSSLDMLSTKRTQRLPKKHGNMSL